MLVHQAKGLNFQSEEDVNAPAFSLAAGSQVNLLRVRCVQETKLMLTTV